MDNYVFMAFSAGKESTEGSVVKRYVGVAPVRILAVNPTKQELEVIYGASLERDLEYVSEKDGVKSARIDFIVKTDEEKCGVDVTTKISFFVRNEYRVNKEKTKVQVIDKYGRTAWVTNEQAKNHEIPMYSNGPANLDKDYRPCYVGEEELTNFVKIYLNIPSVMHYVNNSWVMSDKPEDSEARLDNIAAYFKNDFSEVKNAIALQPNNKIKTLFGVKTNEDNKQFQTVYTQMFLNNRTTDYSKLDKDVTERKLNGAYANTTFEVCDIKEYVVEATTFEETSVENSGFEAPASPWEL